MNWIQVQTAAEGPHTLVGIDVFLPGTPEPGKRYPLVILLHGRNADHTEWMRKVRLERYAEEAGVALALVQGNQNFFVNSVWGYNWGDFVAKEVPAKLAGWFPISSEPEDITVMGVDMGGYGAMMAAQHFPEAIGKAVAVDPILDVAKLYDSGMEPRPEYIFGPREELEAKGFRFSKEGRVPVVLLVGPDGDREARDFAAQRPYVRLVRLKDRDQEERMEEAFQMLMGGAF